MEGKRKYDEFYYSVENKILSFDKLSKDGYSLYEGKMLCPDCHEAELSYVHNVKTPYLRYKRKSRPHSKHCPYQHEVASTESIKKTFEMLNDMQIEYKLDSMIRYLCAEKIVKQTHLIDEPEQHNPMLIENVKEQTRTYSMLRRKSLEAYFTNEDKNEIYVFYAKAKLKLDKKGNFAFIKIQIGKKQISIYRPKSLIPNDIDEQAQYCIVCIGFLEDMKPPYFKIKLLQQNCLKYQKIESGEIKKKF